MRQKREKSASQRGAGQRTSWIVCAIAAVLILFALGGRAIGSGIEPLLGGGNLLTLEQGWKLEGFSPSSDRALPFLATAQELGERCTMRITLPDNGSHASLFLDGKFMRVRVMLDGQPLADSHPGGETLALLRRSMMFVFLPEDYPGQELVVEYTPLLEGYRSYDFPAPMLGSRTQILRELLLEEAPRIAIILAGFCFGALLMISNFRSRRSRSVAGSFFYVGAFSLLFACYFSCRTNLVYLLGCNPYGVYLMDFLLMNLLPAPVLLVVCTQVEQPLKRPAVWALRLVWLSFFVQAGLCVLGVQPQSMQWVGHLVLAISLVASVAALLLGCQGERRWEFLIAFAPFILGSLADLVGYYLPFYPPSSSGLQYGAMLFVLVEAGYVLRAYLRLREQTAKSRFYQRQAYTDALTGLANRAAFARRQAQLEREIDALSDLWCIVADINGLKAVNDSLGHSSGDELIRRASGTLQCFCEQGFELFRTGGDEFVLFGADISQQQVEEAQEQYRLAIEKTACGGGIPVSIAMGCDCLRQDRTDSVARLLKRADARMYRNKESYHSVDSAMVDDGYSPTRGSVI